MKSLSLFGVGIIAFIVIAVVIVVIVLIAIKLISASKSATTDEQDISGKVRNSLSKVRQQKFKAENKILRLKQWSNDIIGTTYKDLFPESDLPYAKEELTTNYEELKKTYSEKLPYEQAEKCDSIVNGYINQIDAEEQKIKAFAKLQTEYEVLKDKMLAVKQRQRKQKKMDKHTQRLQNAQDDISGEAKVIEHGYTLEDLTNEVEQKEEYVNQLEQLSYQYGDEIDSGKSLDYKKNVEKIISKI